MSLFDRWSRKSQAKEIQKCCDALRTEMDGPKWVSPSQVDSAVHQIIRYDDAGLSALNIKTKEAFVGSVLGLITELVKKGHNEASERLVQTFFSYSSDNASVLGVSLSSEWCNAYIQSLLGNNYLPGEAALTKLCRRNPQAWGSAINQILDSPEIIKNPDFYRNDNKAGLRLLWRKAREGQAKRLLQVAKENITILFPEKALDDCGMNTLIGMSKTGYRSAEDLSDLKGWIGDLLLDRGYTKESCRFQVLNVAFGVALDQTTVEQKKALLIQGRIDLVPGLVNAGAQPMASILLGMLVMNKGGTPKDLLGLTWKVDGSNQFRSIMTVIENDKPCPSVVIASFNSQNMKHSIEHASRELFSRPVSTDAGFLADGIASPQQRFEEIYPHLPDFRKALDKRLQSIGQAANPALAK